MSSAAQSVASQGNGAITAPAGLPPQVEELAARVAKELGLPRERLKLVAKGQVLSQATLVQLKDGGASGRGAGSPREPGASLALAHSL